MALRYKETRVFPILDANANKSMYVDRVLEMFCDRETGIRKVNYEFQIGGNEVLIIRNP